MSADHPISSTISAGRSSPQRFVQPMPEVPFSFELPTLLPNHRPGEKTIGNQAADTF
jgi:hypothetical protein